MARRPYGFVRNTILSMLPATAAQIADKLGERSGIVSRTMMDLRDAGFVTSNAPGRGGVAVYRLTEAGLARVPRSARAA